MILLSQLFTLSGAARYTTENTVYVCETDTDATCICRFQLKKQFLSQFLKQQGKINSFQKSIFPKETVFYTYKLLQQERKTFLIPKNESCCTR